MNWYLTFAVFFTFIFIIYAVQSINFNIRRANNQLKDVKINNYLPLIYALLASIFWGLTF